MREQLDLDWWLGVTCSDQRVFRVCVYELRESRVDKACVRINRLSYVRRCRKEELMYIPFRRTKPSTTGVTLAVEWPMSMTNAEPFPAANLVEGHFCPPKSAGQFTDKRGKVQTDAFNTPVFAM